PSPSFPIFTSSLPRFRAASTIEPLATSSGGPTLRPGPGIPWFLAPQRDLPMNWSRLLARWLRSRRRPSPVKSPRLRLLVELLEDRCVPALTPTSSVLMPAFYKALLQRDPDYPGASGLAAK